MAAQLDRAGHPGLAPAVATPRLPLVDRFLPVWIFVAMGLGVALGRALPDLGAALDRVKVAGVSLPIAVGLLWMMYPVLARVRHESLGRFRAQGKLLAASIVFNWVLGPLLKDGDPRAAWALFDLAPGRPVSVGIRRVPYDGAATAAAIRAAEGLPDHFAREIETGGAA